MKNRKSYIYYTLSAITIAYAIASIVYLIIRLTADSVFNIILTVMACITFSAIFIVVGKISWNDDKEAVIEESKEEEIKSTAENPFTVKRILIAVAFFAVFAGIGVGIICFGAWKQADITGSNYMKTTATIQYITVDVDTGDEALRYAFTDREGNLIYAEYASGFVGVAPSEGNEVTVFYNLQNPERIETLCPPVMAYLVGSFFIAVSILAVLLSFGFNKHDTNSLAPLFVGILFTAFAVTLFTALKLAVGGNLALLLLSGGGLFIVGCFGLFGLSFILIGFWDTVNHILKLVKSKIKKSTLI